MATARLKLKTVNFIKVFFYSPTDAQVNCLKNNFKIYIYIKTAPTCFGAITPSSGSALFELAKVTVVKIINKNTSVWLIQWCGVVDLLRVALGSTRGGGESFRSRPD
jgi:hypothetical protein